MLVKIKGYAKHTKLQFEAYMGYGGKNEDTINPSGKHQ
jgi:hypothetical protein